MCVCVPMHTCTPNASVFLSVSVLTEGEKDRADPTNCVKYNGTRKRMLGRRF